MPFGQIRTQGGGGSRNPDLAGRPLWMAPKHRSKNSSAYKKACSKLVIFTL